MPGARSAGAPLTSVSLGGPESLGQLDHRGKAAPKSREAQVFGLNWRGDCLRAQPVAQLSCAGQSYRTASPALLLLRQLDFGHYEGKLIPAHAALPSQAREAESA